MLWFWILLRIVLSPILYLGWWPRNEGMRNVCCLAYMLFLADALQRSASLPPQAGVSFEQVVALAGTAITGADPATVLIDSAAPSVERMPAFVFLLMNVLAFRHHAVDIFDGEESAAAGDASLTRGNLDAEFQEFVLLQVEHVLVGVTSTFLPLLRKLQRAEEDAAFASARVRPGAPPPPRRYDIKALFDLIAVLCHGRAEGGLAFWQGGERHTPRFFAWAVDVREPGQQRALDHARGARDR